ncbi:MAG: hypothetical protein V3V97_14940 [Hyphomicrobiaceae bacterium]
MALDKTIRHKSELGEALDVSQPAFTVNSRFGKRIAGSLMPAGSESSPDWPIIAT